MASRIGVVAEPVRNNQRVVRVGRGQETAVEC